MTINDVTGLIGAFAGLLTALGALIAVLKKPTAGSDRHVGRSPQRRARRGRTDD